MVDAFELTLVQARGQATVYCPPHALNFDRGPTKKARHSHSTPEVHVAVNFGSQNPGAVASVASVEIEKNLAPRSCTSSPDIESPVVPSSPLEFNPLILLLLQLMDLNNPSKTFKYIEFEQEFRKFGIRGILDVYRLPRMVLATFGTLGWYGANHLHAYIEGRLMSLIKPGEGKVADYKQEGGSIEVEGHVADYKQEDLDAVIESGGRIPNLWKGKGRLLKEESQEAIIEWPSDDENEEEKQSLPPIEVLDDDDDVATESSGSF